MRLDLHMHSRMSDGTMTPEEVVEAALAAHLDVISLTDHDTVDGVARAMARAEDERIHVIPGIEVSAAEEVGELHILGYFVDPEQPDLVAHGQWAAGRRLERMEEMVARLRQAGIDIGMEAVLAEAGDDSGSLARPHLARALAASGVVEEPRDAFDTWIGDEHDAFVPTRLLSPAGTIELIHAAGGLAVWAHPPRSRMSELLPGLAGAGLDGIEVYRPNHSRTRIREMERAAKDHGLLVTGGSDWHGPERGPLGEFVVESRDVGAFLEAGGL